MLRKDWKERFADYRNGKHHEMTMDKQKWTLYHTIPTLMTLGKKPFESIVGKGENASNEHFLLFP